ncbi:MAG: hypothetical protein HY262_01130 [Chloroflexi bacterium]|nr:hypothetical protein [Chloroflexota bacterium]
MAPKAPASLAQVPLTQKLLANSSPTLDAYVAAVSEYYRRSRSLAAGTKKRSQLVLGAALGRAAATELRRRLPRLTARTTETAVAGALRVVKADVSEFHKLDGLRLAIEVKPINLAVGRAIWNRFGDIRTFAVNLHIKFPFAVVGGILAIPTFEWKEGRELTTDHLIRRATERLARSAGRRNEGDPPHLLEGVAVVAYDPHSGAISDELPAQGTGLRWEEFIDAMVAAYVARFEGVEEAVKAALTEDGD